MQLNCNVAYKVYDWMTDIRLAGNMSSIEGRLEVYYDGQWGTVCDDTFDNIDAGVVCNSLGFGFVSFSMKFCKINAVMPLIAYIENTGITLPHAMHLVSE